MKTFLEKRLEQKISNLSNQSNQSLKENKMETSTKLTIFGIGTPVLLIILFIICFHSEKVDNGEEGVIIQQPFMVGDEGVNMDMTVATGRVWLWRSNKLIRYNLKPAKITETFDDLITNDRVAVDFISTVFYKVQPGKSNFLHDTFGTNWYANNVAEQFKRFIRNYIRSNKSFALSTNDSNIIDIGQTEIMEMLIAHVNELKLPITITEVVIGKVTLPPNIVAQINETAKETQGKKTEIAGASRELERKQREINKALADQAYAKKFGFTNEQFLTYQALQIEKLRIEMAKEKENVSVIMGNVNPMYNVKK